MAKSDSDSNGLRQDQPECCRGKPRQARESHSGWRVSVGHNERGQPDITKPSRLTSDPICTADRRGGILISSGPVHKLRRALSPSKRVRPRWWKPSGRCRTRIRCRRGKGPTGDRVSAVTRRTHYTRIAGDYIRASNRSGSMSASYISGAGRPGHLIFTSHPKPGSHKRPSNRWRFGRVFHGRTAAGSTRFFGPSTLRTRPLCERRDRSGGGMSRGRRAAGHPALVRLVGPGETAQFVYGRRAGIRFVRPPRGARSPSWRRCLW